MRKIEIWPCTEAWGTAILHGRTENCRVGCFNQQISCTVALLYLLKGNLYDPGFHEVPPPPPLRLRSYSGTVTRAVAYEMCHSLRKVRIYQRHHVTTRNIRATNKPRERENLWPSGWISSQEQTILPASGFLIEEVGRSAKLTKKISDEFWMIGAMLLFPYMISWYTQRISCSFSTSAGQYGAVRNLNVNFMLTTNFSK